MLHVRYARCTSSNPCMQARACAEVHISALTLSNLEGMVLYTPGSMSRVSVSWGCEREVVGLVRWFVRRLVCWFLVSSTPGDP